MAWAQLHGGAKAETFAYMYLLSENKQDTSYKLYM